MVLQLQATTSKLMTGKVDLSENYKAKLYQVFNLLVYTTTQRVDYVIDLGIELRMKLVTVNTQKLFIFWLPQNQINLI